MALAFAFVTLAALPAMAGTLSENPVGGDEVGATPPDRGDGLAVVLDAGSVEGGALVVPGGAFLLHAEYVREGPDLSLVGSDGAEVLVVDFFAVAEPPALSAMVAVMPPGRHHPSICRGIPHLGVAALPGRPLGSMHRETSWLNNRRGKRPEVGGFCGSGW